MIDLLWLVLVTLLAPALLKHGDLQDKLEDTVNYIGAAGLFFLLAASFETSVWTNYIGTYGMYGSYLFQILGWLLLLIGTLLGVVKFLKK